MRGPDTRTTQLFINFRDNAGLDQRGFAPFGQVVSGMEIVDKIERRLRRGAGPGQDPGRGNAYLNKEFPKLDYIRKATLQKPVATTPKPTVTSKPAAPVKNRRPDSVSGAAAADVEHGAGRERAFLRRQPADEGRDLGQLQEAAQRDPRQHVVDVLLLHLAEHLGPGRRRVTQLTRMLRGASSFASDFVSAINPALDAL